MMIRDQSRSNCFTIESKCGDHEELKIFLSNHLIPSRFKQELRKTRENTSFLKGIFAQKSRSFDPVDRWNWWPWSSDDHRPLMRRGRGRDCASNKPRLSVDCGLWSSSISRQMKIMPRWVHVEPISSLIARCDLVCPIEDWCLLDTPRVAQSKASLIIGFMHVSWSRSRGLGSTWSTLSNRSQRLWCVHGHQQKKKPQKHSPTRTKKTKIAPTKDRGEVSICVTTPIISPGLTNPWALYLPTSCHVAPLTGVHVDPSGLLLRVRATCTSRGPCTTLPRGLSATSHPRWSRAPY